MSAEASFPAPEQAGVAAHTPTHLGRVIFAARWLMAPIYVGLFAVLLLLAAKFIQRFIELVPELLRLPGKEMVLIALQLVDIALVANLVLIVLFAGWEIIIGAFIDARHQFAGITFGVLKHRVMSAIIAIAAVDMLETFLHVNDFTPVDALGQLAIFIGLGITGVLLAWMDRLGGNSH